MQESWFPNLTPRSEAEAEFLGVFRDQAQRWPGVQAKDAWAIGMSPLVFRIPVPEVPLRALVVEAWPEGVEAKQARLFAADRVIIRGPTVFGYWDRGHLDDDFDPMDPETLVIQGLDASAAQHGEWAGAWVQRQLSRRLTLLEWTSGSRRWVFEDTGWILHEERRGSRRQLRKEGPRRTLLRNGDDRS